MGSGRQLKSLHRLFAFEVLGGASAAEAYRSCYPSSSRTAAETNGPRLLRSAQVASFVEARRSKVLAKAEITAELKLETVLLEVKRMLYADPADALGPDGAPRPLQDWPVDLRRALASIDVEEVWQGTGKRRRFTGRVHRWKFWNKPAASEQLLRHMGAFRDVLEVVDTRDVADVTDEEWAELALLRHRVRGKEPADG